jgi:co-chaperonin GroES (HSP10)
MSLKLKMTTGKLLVECENKEEKTASGLIIPTKENRLQRYLKGKVLSASDYKYIYDDKEKKVVIGKLPMEVKVGDIILFEEARSRDYTDPKEPTKKYYLLDEDLVYGVIIEE